MTYNRGKGKAYAWLVAHQHFNGDECLIWPFARLPHGRGSLGYNGKLYYAHRLMCEMVKGPCPEGLVCAHSCGNGHLGCVNPNHLSWKTQTDNHLDQRKHGTSITNPWGGRSRFSNEQIQQMRDLAETETCAQTAKRFDCNEWTVGYWRRVTRMPVPRSMSPAAIKRREKNSRLSLSPC